jgi:tRNA threonylcarbamoyladenosine biosynthesis protein TsaE
VALAESRLRDGRALSIVEASPDDAAVLRSVIVDAFSNRPVVKPTPAALSETDESVAEAISRGFAVLALVEGEPAGTIIVSLDRAEAGIHRVSVRPRFQRLGVASVMIEVVLQLLAEHQVKQVKLVAREEFPQVVAWWQRHGFTQYDKDTPNVYLARGVSQRVEIPTAEDMQEFGQRLAKQLRAGDLLIVSGDLGAGKTTLAQGVGVGLGVEGPVISPTFVLSRIHPAKDGGPGLLHVDAYRLGSWDELEDLDLQTDDVVTFVEWGAGIAEGLADQRLEIDIRRSLDPGDETRFVFLTPIGERWAGFGC